MHKWYETKRHPLLASMETDAVLSEWFLVDTTNQCVLAHVYSVGYTVTPLKSYPSMWLWSCKMYGEYAGVVKDRIESLEKAKEHAENLFSDGTLRQDI